jgi:hypothetical protein
MIVLARYAKAFGALAGGTVFTGNSADALRWLPAVLRAAVWCVQVTQSLVQHLNTNMKVAIDKADDAEADSGQAKQQVRQPAQQRCAACVMLPVMAACSCKRRLSKPAFVVWHVCQELELQQITGNTALYLQAVCMRVHAQGACNLVQHGAGALGKGIQFRSVCVVTQCACAYVN